MKFVEYRMSQVVRSWVLHDLRRHGQRQGYPISSEIPIDIEGYAFTSCIEPKLVWKIPIIIQTKEIREEAGFEKTHEQVCRSVYIAIRRSMRKSLAKLLKIQRKLGYVLLAIQTSKFYDCREVCGGEEAYYSQFTAIFCPRQWPTAWAWPHEPCGPSTFRPFAPAGQSTAAQTFMTQLST